MENNLPIAQALSEIMKAVGAIAKKDKNTAQGFNFRGIDSVVNAVSPALQKFGVIVVPSVEEYDYQTVEIGKNRTAMGHVRVKVTYTFIGANGDSLKATVESVTTPTLSETMLGSNEYCALAISTRRTTPAAITVP